MKKIISPMMRVGILIVVAYIIIERFIIPIPDLIAIPLLLVSIILVVVGGFKMKKVKKTK